MEMVTCPRRPAGLKSITYTLYLRPVPFQEFIPHLIAVSFKKKKVGGGEGEEETVKLSISYHNSFVFCPTVIADLFESSYMHALLI